jgi:hypothetical protein
MLTGPSEPARGGRPPPDVVRVTYPLLLECAYCASVGVTRPAALRGQ